MTAIRIQALTPMYSTIALAFTVTAFAQNALCGQFDWPQWQGPDRTAHSKETGLLQEWPKDGPPLAWKIKGLGGGDSAPSVAAGRIYGMSHRGSDEFVWALSEKDGEEVICTPGGEETTMVALSKLNGETIWKSFVPDRAGGGQSQNRGPGGGGPSAMPNNPVLSALDKDHNKEISAEELAAAPAVLLELDNNKDGKLSEDEVSPQRGDSQGNRPRPRRGPGIMRMMKALSALDANEDGVIEEAEIKNAVASLRKLDVNHDGKLTEDEVGMKFMGPQNTGAAYSSAIAIDFGGQRQYVQLLAMTVAGVSAADGKLLWRYDKPANSMHINISTPLYHDGYVFAASAYGAGGGLARLVKKETGEFAAEEVWFSKSMENHHGGVILHDGALFGANGGNGGGYLACLDFKTGEVLWNERDSDKRRVTKGSVAFADDRIYYRTEEGPIVLIEPSRKEYL